MGLIKPPTREEVATVLRQLIQGSLTRQEASDWATPWITRFDAIDDAKVRHAVGCLAGADLPTTDRDYLYGKTDFESWLLDLIA